MGLGLVMNTVSGRTSYSEKGTAMAADHECGNDGESTIIRALFRLDWFHAW